MHCSNLFICLDYIGAHKSPCESIRVYRSFICHCFSCDVETHLYALSPLESIWVHMSPYEFYITLFLMWSLNWIVFLDHILAHKSPYEPMGVHLRFICHCFTYDVKIIHLPGAHRSPYESMWDHKSPYELYMSMLLMWCCFEPIRVHMSP